MLCPIKKHEVFDQTQQPVFVIDIFICFILQKKYYFWVYHNTFTMNLVLWIKGIKELSDNLNFPQIYQIWALIAWFCALLDTALDVLVIFPFKQAGILCV